MFVPAKVDVVHAALTLADLRLADARKLADGSEAPTAQSHNIHRYTEPQNPLSRSLRGSGPSSSPDSSIRSASAARLIAVGRRKVLQLVFDIF
jgi:hypothetical protein